MTKDTLKKWMHEHHHTDQWVAEKCSVKPRTVQSWRSNRPIPSKAVLILESLMAADHLKQQEKDSPPHNLVLEFDHNEFDKICSAAAREHKPPRKWAQDTLNQIADEDLSDFLRQYHSKVAEDAGGYNTSQNGAAS